MIYLNNAGTTWPKPESVYQAINKFNLLGPDEWLEVFQEGHEVATSFFGIQDKDRFLFTQSCSQSLAVAFSDFPWERGDRLAISTMEHHALSRWYYKIQRERGVEGVIIPRGSDGPFDLELLETELKKGVRMVAISMASNVTGEVLPFEKVIELCKEYGAVCLLDGAQAAGIVPINLSELDPDIFVFAGHKGPFGPQGIGGLYISSRISMECPSAACEITPGANSHSVFPTYCDTGSAPMQAIAGMTAGLKWLTQQGWEPLLKHRGMLTDQLRGGLREIPGISIIGNPDYRPVTGAVSIQSTTLPLEKLKIKLAEEYDIRGSHGFQCAPLAHEALGTDSSGTLRFSVGPMNTEADIVSLLAALKEVTSAS